MAKEKPLKCITCSWVLLTIKHITTVLPIDQ
ncbi:hypothetical protein FWK35_00011350 [Aphis craccivora]|uniref:Uncharacterized protein n=1 Tax=Aphis craccivora TaxID=307492 RepID=A0A6G0Z5N9_APHCR|nr:hypothetical protein FWK35_00011350 [Aphis craccivora]